MKNSEYDLNKILPAYIQRKSESKDEGRIYDELRLSPTPTIISGGQSGIDSVALMAASFLGLPAFAITPKGGRREGSPIEDFQKNTGTILRKIELSSDSYRFRTYANVYFADVTVIYDFVGKSEGTLATIDACNALHRPYLLLTDTGNAEKEALYSFLVNHSPDVINFAGNSLSKINEQIQDATYSNIVAALKKYCFCKKACKSDEIHNCANAHIKPTVAIPNFSVSKNIFRDFLRSQYDIDFNFSSKLVYDFNDIRLILARAREIINLVKCGVNIGFVGEDLCLEYNYGEKILLDTGLIPNNTVLVSKPKANLANAKICSQYPNLAKELLNRRDITHISGSAEAYITLDIYNACVDSYQTGKTVSQNGLMVNSVLKTTSLVMIGNEEILHTDFYRRFVKYLSDL
ncbi:MAG: hypothetical protein J6A83_07055 [Clostridia bacterium]|nr:hypothetical protein [Clostridia bacterium]